ncbi:UNVERIFIED_CONTAM: hypothetical protein FKN15_078301 [Acipenser sinensis]
MGRKSCKKQQKRRQQRQLPLGDVGRSYVVDEWYPGCGEFGHTVAICPTQYQEEEVEPQPQEEDGWEALLRSMGVPYCCFICGEVGHFPANCPLPPVRDLWYPPTPAEGEFLLVPPPPAEGACLLVSRLQPEGEEPLPPSQPEGEEALPPSQPEGEEPLPSLPPQARGEEQELPLPPTPPTEGGCLLPAVFGCGNEQRVCVYQLKAPNQQTGTVQQSARNKRVPITQTKAAVKP